VRGNLGLLASGFLGEGVRMGSLGYRFSARERARLASYGAAIRAGFYHDGWGDAGPAPPTEVRLCFARLLPSGAVAPWRRRVRGLAHTDFDNLATALRRLGVLRQRVYLQHTPGGGLVFVCSEVRPVEGPVGSSWDRKLLAIYGLEPGRPGPPGRASLVLNWNWPVRRSERARGDDARAFDFIALEEESAMATNTPARVNVMDYSGKEFLLNLDRSERASFYALLDEAPWEGPTASGHWQVRDVCGHLMDVTEGYLARFALARGGQEAPAPLGLPIMAEKLDEGALRFRSLTKEQAIARLKSASDQLFEIFDGLDQQSWAGEMVSHVYMGPLPACFFAGFQLIDYSIHAWDIKVGLGRDEPLSDEAAITLIPFMLLVIQYTVDAAQAEDLKCSFGIEISGPGGGSWRVSVDGTTVSYAEGPTDGCQTIFNFTPNEFVLSTYQRQRSGTATGDLVLAERLRDLLFKI
jgi:uncharacterized protein (TIGR03083 family)